MELFSVCFFLDGRRRKRGVVGWIALENSGLKLLETLWKSQKTDMVDLLINELWKEI